MGLMSWCISDDRVAVPGIDDDDDGCVVGKLVKDRGADALEVVISLREVRTTLSLDLQTQFVIDRLLSKARSNMRSPSLRWVSIPHQLSRHQIVLHRQMRNSH
jgi:hypothetical protein